MKRKKKVIKKPIVDGILIKGFEDKYSINQNGDIFNINTGRKRENSLGTGGYYFIQLHNNGLIKRFDIHRLIALHFIKNINPEVLTDVNHIDGNKTNNKIENLEWVTKSQNMQHSYHILGKKNNIPLWLKYGENLNSKDILQYNKSGDFIKEWSSIKEASDMLGIEKSTISACCRGVKSRKTAGGFIWKFKNYET